MLASLLYSIVRLLLDLLNVRDRDQAELQSEVWGVSIRAVFIRQIWLDG